jgi:hypothetical protein
MPVLVFVCKCFVGVGIFAGAQQDPARLGKIYDSRFFL